jgi:ABC-type multidrug transport system permease subunit
MENFWSWFWKLFAAALAAALVISIILGMAQGSFNIVANIAQKIIIVSIGICGIIGFVVVPIELYITDRISRSKNNND